MSKRVKAVSMGFKGGKRIREGAIFFVGDNEKSKWFIDYPDESKPKTEEKVDGKDVSDLMM